eukprot:g8755.t1
MVRTLLNAAISAQEKGTVGHHLRRYFNCEPNVISFNAACSACEKAAQWICSLQLFKWAKEKDLQVDTISANALLATCRGARRWQEVLQLLKELSLGIFLDDLALRLAIETHLDRRVGRVDQDTLELMDRMDLLWINVLSRKLSKGWLDFGLRLIKARAEAMEFEVSGARPGAKAQGMCLVVGLDKDSVEKHCKASSSKGENCQIAACLFSRAFSVSGSLSAVESFVEKAKAAGALHLWPVG